jgi:hypothetical protein
VLFVHLAIFYQIPNFVKDLIYDVLTQNNQQLYIQALSEVGGAQPFQTVHGELAKRLKKRDDLVKQNGNRSSKNIFGLENEVAVWRRVKK